MFVMEYKSTMFSETWSISSPSTFLLMPQFHWGFTGTVRRGSKRDNWGVKRSRHEIKLKGQTLLSCVSGSAVFCPNCLYIPSTLCPGSHPGFCHGNCKTIMGFWQLVFLPAIRWPVQMELLLLLKDRVAEWADTAVSRAFHAKPC